MNRDEMDEFINEIDLMHDQQQELYGLLWRARADECDCKVCVRIRAKAWDDQNNLIPGQGV